MLICPQCNAENPETHKFCQKCGISLTTKTCDHCEAEVPLDAETCSNCGASTATLRWAIFSSLLATSVQDLAQLESESPSTSEPEVTPAPEVPTAEEGTEPIATATTEPILSSYLDPAQRYRFAREETPQQTMMEAVPLLMAQVIDTKPFHESRLDQLLTEFSETEAGASPQVPPLVQPYLLLQDYAPKVPKVWDGWEDEEQTAVILEDRSTYQGLGDYLRQYSLPLPQILYWFKEMAELWEPFSQRQATQSFFQEENICLDEDLTLCLRQIYGNPPEQTLNLIDLIDLWVDFLGTTDYGSEVLTPLLAQTQAGEISTPAELCEALEAIAKQILTAEDGSSEVPEEADLEETLEGEHFDEEDEIEVGEVHDVQMMNSLAFSEEEPMDYSSDTDDMETIVLPVSLLSLSDSGMTNVGRDREHNEDFFGITTQVNRQSTNMNQSIQARGIYIVCDGMGGHDAGEVASAMAVEKLQSYFKDHWQEEFPDEETIRQGILEANQTIYDVNIDNSRSGVSRMGTTLVMALIQDTKLAIAHVGDSRAYRVTRKWGLEQLTVDHEVGQREIQRGVEPQLAYGRPDAYQLTQALGPRSNEFVHPDVSIQEIKEDTVLLLCSDGLCDHDFVENCWESYLTPLISSRANLDQELSKIITDGNEYNGHDNLTGVVVRIKVRSQIPSL